MSGTAKTWAVYSVGSAISVTLIGVATYLFGPWGSEPKAVAPVVQIQPNPVAPVVVVPKPKVYDWSQLTPVRTLESPNGQPRAIIFSPDGRYLAAGSEISCSPHPNSGEVRIWNVAEDRIETTLKLDSTVWAMGFSPDMKTFVADGQDDGVVFNVGTWTTRFHFADPLPFSVAFTADSKAFFSGTSQFAWDSGSGVKVPSRNIEYNFDQFAFSSDGKLFSTGSMIFRYPSWEAIWNPLDKLIYARRFTPDGKTLVSFGTQTLDTWNVSNPSNVRLIKSLIRGAMWTANFSVSSDSRVCVVLPQDGARIYSLPELTKVKDIEFPSRVIAADFQPGGDLLAVLTERNGVAIFRASLAP